jgi:hypothetical protein
MNDEVIQLDFNEVAEEDLNQAIESIYKYHESFLVEKVEAGIFPSLKQVVSPKIPSFCLHLETLVSRQWTRVLDQPSCVLNNTGSLHVQTTDP